MWARRDPTTTFRMSQQPSGEITNLKGFKSNTVAWEVKTFSFTEVSGVECISFQRTARPDSV